MKYSDEEKKLIIKNKPENISVVEYCNNIGISKSIYYVWEKQLKEKKRSFIDVTGLVLDDSPVNISLNIKDITINLDSNYNEELLIKVINSLRKI